MPFNKEQYAKNYKEGDRVRGAKVIRSCLQCGKEVEDYVSQHPRKYCSESCYYEAMREKISVPCSHCGSNVEITPARLKWSKVRGRGKIFCNKECQRKGNSGDGSGNWIEDRTKVKNPRAARSLQYKEWRTSVFERDNYTCQKCGAVGGYLHAHHIKEWAYHSELRYEVSNGMTLCRRPCHKEVHDARRSNRKVPDEHIAEIKSMRSDGKTLREIGKKYGISEGHVSVICSGKKRTKPYTQP